MYSKGGSNNNSFYGNKDNNNSTKAGIGIGAAGGGGGGQKREIRLLSCIVRDMGSSASSAQQLYRRSPNASPDRDRNTSSYHPPFLSCKSPKLPPISKPYNEHGYKLNEEDNDKNRTDRSFKCKGNDNNQIFDATLIDNAESEVVRELIGSPSYKNSLILKMLCKTVSGSNMNVDRCTDQCTDGCTDTLSACGTVSGESQSSNFERLH